MSEAEKWAEPAVSTIIKPAIPIGIGTGIVYYKKAGNATKKVI